MEYLDPSHGWVTLFEYAKTHRSIVQEPFHPRLVGLLEVMKKKKIVHGDLRPANIMVRKSDIGDDLEVKVVDFDWAGICGEAKYPLSRNPEIKWPGQDGGLIGADDDETLLRRTLK
ncbi:hypothetical protein CPB86DRAFT_329594 [Serendipita vermifera]|nr:hypothetical protein CPB86DRAFT_329594 [Serendipita vermifera]